MYPFQYSFLLCFKKSTKKSSIAFPDAVGLFGFLEGPPENITFRTEKNIGMSLSLFGKIALDYGDHSIWTPLVPTPHHNIHARD